MSRSVVADILVEAPAPVTPGFFQRCWRAIRADWPVFAAMLVAAVFHFATIRPQHNWGGDFSQYIAHARNIVEGRSYADTGYIYNPAAPKVGPAIYPPVFPVILAPVINLWGMNYTAMKAEVAAFFIGALVLAYLNFRTELTRFYRTCFIALLGFSPYFWDIRDNVISDIPFLFMACATLLVAQRMRHYAPMEVRHGINAAALAVLIYLCIELRNSGVALVALLPAYDIFRRRRLRAFSICVAALSVAAVLAQSLVFLKGSTTYLDQLRAGHWPGVVFSNLVFYAAAPNLLWRNGHSLAAGCVLYVVLSGVALLGFITRVRERGIGLWDVYVPLQVGTVVLWPSDPGMRFLIPLVPLYFMYVCAGVAAIQARIAVRWRPAFVATFLIAAFGSYAGAYSVLDFGPVAEGPESPSYRAICDYVKKSAAPRDILLCENPRVLALYTGRRAAPYSPDTRDPAVLWSYCRRLGIRYVLVASAVPSDRHVLMPFVQAYPSSMQEVYAVPGFTLFRLK